MRIIHFDVDRELKTYLSGETYAQSIQTVDRIDVSETEGISIKTAAKADKETLSLFPRLKLLITRTVGVDHIDLEYCKQKGIAVYHILDYGAFNIAEHAFALLLSGTRNILTTQVDIKAGQFSYQGHLGISLKGKTIGIVGTGRIGLEMIKRAKGFEMEVIAYDVYKNEKAQKELGYEYVELDDLFSNSDVISLHAPLLDSTRHMVDEAAISKMREGIVLINTARGELIDTDALLKHIKKFRLIGLDVLEGEKEFSGDHPLLTHSNVIITPHMAFYSDASIKKIAEETERLIQNYETNMSQGLDLPAEGRVE